MRRTITTKNEQDLLEVKINYFKDLDSKIFRGSKTKLRKIPKISALDPFIRH